MGGMGLGLQAGQPRLMEGMDGFTDALVAAVELGLICWGACPWLLASRIWQRRRVKASEDRRPCFRVTSSSGLSSRTISVLMPVECQVFLSCQPFNRGFALGR